jgi:hypothetical protein
MIGHPAPRRLLDFLDGRLDDAVRRRVASHLADCQRCRDQVQGFREVRLALASDGAAPSAALWDRITASRAAGAVVLLPRVLDHPPRRAAVIDWRGRPDRRTLRRYAAVAALLTVGALALRLPLAEFGLRSHLMAWRHAVTDFWSNTLTADAPAVEARVDAPPARPVAARLRPFTARYEVRHYVDGRLTSVDSATTLTVQPLGADWQVRITEAGDGEWRTVVAVLDGTTLTLRTLRTLRTGSRRRDAVGFVRSYWLSVVGDSFALNQVTSGSMGERPHTTTTGPDPFRGTIPPGTVVDQYEWGVRAAQMTAVPLHRRWFGSFGFLMLSTPSHRAADTGALSVYPFSFRVVDDATLDLPIGPTRTWQVEQWTRDGVNRFEREYYRATDGLLAATWTDPRLGNRTEQRLLSVSYP